MYTHLKRRFVECSVHDFFYYFDLGELHVAFQIAPFLNEVGRGEKGTGRGREKGEEGTGKRGGN